jgi:hypothetical protein
MLVLAIAAIGLAAWVYLAGFHGGFWIVSRYDDLPTPTRASAIACARSCRSPMRAACR